MGVGDQIQSTEHHRQTADMISVAKAPSLQQELVEFTIEGHINNYYASKRLPQRIKCIRQHGLIKFEHRKRILAVLCEADSTIYRVGALTMQWMLIKKALREVNWKVRAYE